MVKGHKSNKNQYKGIIQTQVPLQYHNDTGRRNNSSSIEPSQRPKNFLQEQHLTQIKMHDLTRLQQIFHETNINPTTTQDDPPPLIKSNVTTSRVSPRRTTKNAPQEMTPSPTVSNKPTCEGKHDNSPAYNTRIRKHIITQEAVLQMININQSSFTAHQAASRKYREEALEAVLNEETGDLIEYRHLIADPK